MAGKGCWVGPMQAKVVASKTEAMHDRRPHLAYSTRWDEDVSTSAASTILVIGMVLCARRRGAGAKLGIILC